MRLWTVQYLYGEDSCEYSGIFFAGNKGDIVRLWDQEFIILSIKYIPQQGICQVSLTKDYYQ